MGNGNKVTRDAEVWAQSGLPRFAASVAGFSLTCRKLPSTTFVLPILSGGRKHITSLTSNPFPTPFCRCNRKPTSLKDLEHGLAQDGDNFYLTGKKKSILLERNKLPNHRSYWPNWVDPELLPSVQASVEDDVTGILPHYASAVWHWESQEQVIRDLRC